MHGTQRVYFYLVALAGLLVAIVSLTNAVAGLVPLAMQSAPQADPLGLLIRNGALFWSALALVGLVLWATHWWQANRIARTLTIAGAAERKQPIRKAYLYIGQFVTVIALVVQATLALYDVLMFILGAPRTQLAPWPARPIAAAIGALIALGFWLHLSVVTAADGDRGREPGNSASWRRAYYYLLSALGVGMAIIGAGEFMRNFLTVAAQVYVFEEGAGDPNSWRSAVALSLAAAVAGLPLAVIAWSRANRVVFELARPRGGRPILGAAAAVETEDELNAISRKLLIFVGLAAGTGTVLASLAVLIWQGFGLIVGQSGTPLSELWQAMLAPALAYLPLGAILGAVYGNAMRNDMNWAPEREEAAVLRRLYFYLVAALGLAGFWFGLQAWLILAVLLIAGVWPLAVLATQRAAEYFGLAAALLLIGGPTWWRNWSFQQSLARDRGPAGHDEAASGIRRVYLYGVVIAAVIVAVGTLAVVIIRAPEWLFGPTTTARFAEAVAELAVGIALALAWWIGHGFVLRADQRLRALHTPPPPPPAEELPAEEFADEDYANEGLVGEDYTGVETDDQALPPIPQAPPLTAVRTPDVEPAPPAGSALQPAPAFTVRPVPPAVELPREVVAVVDGADGTLGAALLHALSASLPGVTLWPVGLNAAASQAMAAALPGRPPVTLPADALSRVSVIVGPSDIVAPGGLNGEVAPEMAAAMASSPARKVLLPPRNRQLRWVAAPDWPLERWIELAVVEVSESIAG